MLKSYSDLLDSVFDAMPSDGRIVDYTISKYKSFEEGSVVTNKIFMYVDFLRVDNPKEAITATALMGGLSPIFEIGVVFSEGSKTELRRFKLEGAFIVDGIISNFTEMSMRGLTSGEFNAVENNGLKYSREISFY